VTFHRVSRDEKLAKEFLDEHHDDDARLYLCRPLHKPLPRPQKQHGCQSPHIEMVGSLLERGVELEEPEQSSAT
jgi:hypothetical protein